MDFNYTTPTVPISLQTDVHGFIGPFMGVYFLQPQLWSNCQIIALVVLVMLFTEVIARSVPAAFSLVTASRIPLNPKLHLKWLSIKDVVFILSSKVSIVIFFYHFLTVLYATPTVLWKLEQANLTNSVLVLVPLYITYDFFYVLWHKFLHLRCVYGYIHKHHHRQISPTRGHYDALNVHPVEFIVGEYIHLVVCWMIPCHILGALLFLFLGMVLATLNHTRLACSIPGVYNVKNHAVHHRLPDTNMGQYTMFWDKVFGWYQAYDEALAKGS